MSNSAYAKVGQPFPNYQGPRAAQQPAQPASTGWTAPTTIYEKMRQVNMSAVSLNNDVTAHVKRDLFKSSWGSWFANWQAFFAKYQKTAERFAALTYTDELFQQTLSYESQLVSWYDAYGREKDGDKPVAPPSGLPPTPNLPIPPSKELPTAPTDNGLVIPWWGWALGIVVVAGAGYATYRYVQRARAIKRVLDDHVVPAALHAYGGPVGGQLAAGYGQFAAAARDPMTGQPVMVASHPPMTPLVMPLPYSRYPGT